MIKDTAHKIVAILLVFSSTYTAFFLGDGFEPFSRKECSSSILILYLVCLNLPRKIMSSKSNFL